ncbi:hypothetical protein P5V15_003768 [Pogonomyrmex californicus]
MKSMEILMNEVRGQQRSKRHRRRAWRSSLEPIYLQFDGQGNKEERRIRKEVNPFLTRAISNDRVCVSRWIDLQEGALRAEERSNNEIILDTKLLIRYHSFAGGCNNQSHSSLSSLSEPATCESDQISWRRGDRVYNYNNPYQASCRGVSSNYEGNLQKQVLCNSVYQSSNNRVVANANVCGTNVVVGSSFGFKLPSSPDSLENSPSNALGSSSSVAQTASARATVVSGYAYSENVFFPRSCATTFTTSPTSTNTRSIAATNAAPAAANVLYNEQTTPSRRNFVGNKTEFHGVCPEERQPTCSGSSSSSSRFVQSAAYNATLNTLKVLPNAQGPVGNISGNISGNNVCVDRNNFPKEFPSGRIIPHTVTQEQHKHQQQEAPVPVVPSYRVNSAGYFLESGAELREEPAINTSAADTVAINVRNCGNFKQQSFCTGRSTSTTTTTTSGGASLVKHAALPPYLDTISPISDVASEMKYETQSGPPAAPPHLTSSGVEPPHSSQGSGIVVGSSPTEIDTLLLPWPNGPEFLEGGVPDAKQTVAFQENWESLLGATVSAEQSMSDVKMLPLPPFTNYTGHLQINGIPGHHYHTIASSGQRSAIEVGSVSPTPSTNQEFFESPVVSSSTPCPQASQKQQQQNHQQPQQHHPHNQQPQQQQQQQLPQSTQHTIYEDMEDIAQIIGSAIADTTVPGNGNGPNSEQETDASGDWIDIADWITNHSPKTQETTSPNSFATHQIYVTTTPSTQTPQQHAGSALQNLLSQGKLEYAPLLQARLQAGNAAAAANLQNAASCGETPSSTSPYPPLSPPNRVSTSCSPDDILHSSFAAPSHPRKRSRSSPGSGGPPSKKGPAAGTATLPYGTESGLMSGKDKPVHRCHICQRGFLNKSNIKVHLRTHTGEKPFRCDVCSKAFRQKAHLIKHQQIHKRIGRD